MLATLRSKRENLVCGTKWVKTKTQTQQQFHGISLLVKYELKIPCLQASSTKTNTETIVKALQHSSEIHGYIWRWHSLQSVISGGYKTVMRFIRLTYPITFQLWINLWTSKKKKKVSCYLLIMLYACIYLCNSNYSKFHKTNLQINISKFQEKNESPHALHPSSLLVVRIKSKIQNYTSVPLRPPPPPHPTPPPLKKKKKTGSLFEP